GTRYRRSLTRHTRPADPQGARGGGTARLRHRTLDPGRYRRRGADRGGLALPGAAAPGGPRLRRVAVGAVRKQPPRPLLRGYTRRPAAPARRRLVVDALRPR